MKNCKRKKRHRTEVMDKFNAFRLRFPGAVQEEVLAEGVYITLARVTALVPSDKLLDGDKLEIIGEGISRRSGQHILDEPNQTLAKSIALGRATVACATKLANHKSWVKLRSLLMA